jgi:RimJ/RimL family protein N-acetyltransferase
MTSEPPVGPVIDATPSARPGPVVLEGRHARIEKLDAAAHGAALWQAMRHDDTLWTYMGYGPFPDRDAFDAWMEARAAAADPYAYAVVDHVRGEATGTVTLMEIRPAMRVIEMGNIVYSPLLQRTIAATEVQYLLASHVFETLRYRRYEWKCNALNAPSRHAALRLGFTFEGVFRQHMIVKGRNRDTAWYSMLDTEWPERKKAFERWLDPSNFDADGRQRVSLSALNGAG